MFIVINLLKTESEILEKQLRHSVGNVRGNDTVPILGGVHGGDMRSTECRL